MKLLPMMLAVTLLAGCSSVTRFMDVTNLVDYSDHKSVKVLEIPSDLDSPNFDKTYVTNVSDTMAAKKSERLDQVPLVDKNMGPPPASSVQLVAKGSTVAMTIDENISVVWGRVNDTLKGMGMTISKSDRSSGVIAARDRSLVSDPGSPIGRFLNESLGKVNQGKEYLFRVTGNSDKTTIEVTDKNGKALSADDAKVVLNRLRKEYTS